MLKEFWKQLFLVSLFFGLSRVVCFFVCFILVVVFLEFLGFLKAFACLFCFPRVLLLSVSVFVFRFFLEFILCIRWVLLCSWLFLYSTLLS